MNYLPDIKINDYDYNLEKFRIAEYPEKSRNLSKLLYYNIITDNIEHFKFENIINLIPKYSLLILNTTKVIEARLIMTKPTGGKCEILLIEPISPSSDPIITMASYNVCQWKCMISGRNLSEGMLLKTERCENLQTQIISKQDNYALVEFKWDSNQTFSELIGTIGLIPLPPYIERDTEEIDSERYQTVYANSEGSIAAPTAGLHFTEEILENLNSNDIKIDELVLHVGPGTFLPVSSENVREHNMHKERIMVNKSTILAIIENIKNKKDIIAVGTTSVRTLESLYWIGLKLILGEFSVNDEFLLEQDTPYKYEDDSANISVIDSMTRVIEYMELNNIDQIFAYTKLFIMPRYDFKILNGIITNFHLPKSTLLLLISAFMGIGKWKNVYDEAIKNEYRFLSYGDSSFLFRPL